MKKMKLLGIMVLTALTLLGCQNTSDRESVLEDQVAQLEQQVTSLELENEKLSSSSEGNKTALEIPSETEDAFNDTLETLTTDVEAVVKKASSSSADGSKEENQKKFFELKGALQEVENRLEHYEDKIEDDYRQGNLSYEKAREDEIKIERLEDKLDDAEDRLENVFGYDD